MASIQYEVGADSAVGAFEARSERCAAAMAGLRFNLERDPRVSAEIPGTELLLTAARPFPDVPLVKCWYTYDPERDVVRIVDFRVIEDD